MPLCKKHQHDKYFASLLTSPFAALSPSLLSLPCLLTLSFQPSHQSFSFPFLFISGFLSPQTPKPASPKVRKEKMSPAASTRWCPTPEQLMILEEMYRGGIRTPNASQIQQITAHLSFYGKIEGKNVFYWFQNHKARDRQKLRRKLCRQQQQQLQLQLQQQNHNHHHLLHHCDSSGSAALQQLSSYNSSLFLPQGGLVQDQAAQAVNYAWNVDISSGRNDSDISMTMMYGRDWLMKTDVGATTFCCNKPLKTLELFPITTTGLKDESTTPKHFSTSSSTN